MTIRFLRQALLGQYRGRFCNAQKRMNILCTFLADRSTLQTLKQLAGDNLPINDELGYLTPKPAPVTNQALQVLRRRKGRR